MIMYNTEPGGGGYTKPSEFVNVESGLLSQSSQASYSSYNFALMGSFGGSTISPNSIQAAIAFS